MRSLDILDEMLITDYYLTLNGKKELLEDHPIGKKWKSLYKMRSQLHDLPMAMEKKLAVVLREWKGEKN